MKPLSNTTIFRNLALVPETTLGEERQWLDMKWEILVGAALSRLPAREKNLLIVRGYFNNSFFQIAACEQMTERAAHKNYLRLVKKLKREIMHDFIPLHDIYKEQILWKLSKNWS